MQILPMGGGEHDPAEEFRAAMRAMAATVTIVSTALHGRRYGMTATAVVSVSMEPPSLLVSVNRNASIHPALGEGRKLCVNILTAAHRSHCANFSGGRKGEDRFHGQEWSEDEGVPYLVSAKSNIFCRVDRAVDYGTHTLFLCRVENVLLNRSGQPLVWMAGQFLPAPEETPPRLQLADCAK